MSPWIWVSLWRLRLPPANGWVIDASPCAARNWCNYYFRKCYMTSSRRGMMLLSTFRMIPSADLIIGRMPFGYSESIFVHVMPMNRRSSWKAVHRMLVRASGSTKPIIIFSRKVASTLKADFSCGECFFSQSSFQKIQNLRNVLMLLNVRSKTGTIYFYFRWSTTAVLVYIDLALSSWCRSLWDPAVRSMIDIGASPWWIVSEFRSIPRTKWSFEQSFSFA